MSVKKYVKAFVAGMAFPAIFLPLAYTVLFWLHNPMMMKQHILNFIPMYIPIVFGIANMLYVKLSDGMPSRNTNTALWTTGIILGFIVALIGVFVAHIPTLLLGEIHHDLIYTPLIVLPLIYGLIFRYIIKSLNKLLAV